MNYRTESRVISYLLLIIGLLSTRIGGIVSSYAFILIYLIFLWMIYRNTPQKRYKAQIVLDVYTVLVIVQTFKSIVISGNYWMYKSVLWAFIVLMFVLIIKYMQYPFMLIRSFRPWFKYCLWLFIPLILFIPDTTSYGIYLSPLLLLIFFFPNLSRKWKITTAFFVFLAVSDLGARSICLKFGMCTAISCLVMLGVRLKKWQFNAISVTMFITPVLLLFLALSGVFNIFKTEEYISSPHTRKKIVHGEIVEENLLADTRTFLYTKVMLNSYKNKSIIWGKGVGLGTDVLDVGKEQGKAGRKNEIGVLNLFEWCGLVGVAIWFLALFIPVWLSINRSNNYSIKVIGLYLAFRWVIFWIEDIQDFFIDNVVLYTIIGICYSPYFRAMDEKTITNTFLSLVQHSRKRILNNTNF